MLSLYERSSSTVLLDSAEIDTEPGSDLYECKIALKLTGPMPSVLVFAPGWRGTFTAKPKFDDPFILELESAKGQRFFRSADVDIDCFRAVAHGSEMDLIFAFICRVPFEDASGLLTYLKQNVNVIFDSAQTKIPAKEKPAEPEQEATPAPEPPAPGPEPDPDPTGHKEAQYALLDDTAPNIIRTIRASDDIDAIEKLQAAEQAGKARKGLLKAMAEHLEALKAMAATGTEAQPEEAEEPEQEEQEGEPEREELPPLSAEDSGVKPADEAPEKDVFPEDEKEENEDNGYGLEATIAWAQLEGGERVAGRIVAVDRETNEIEILDLGQDVPLRIPASVIESKFPVAGHLKPLCYLVDLYKEMAEDKLKVASWNSMLKAMGQAWKAEELEQNANGSYLLTEGIVQEAIDLSPSVQA